MIVSGVMNVHPPTATYRALTICVKDTISLSPAQCRTKRILKIKSNFFYPPRSHRPLITVSPALTGAAITVLAFAEPFIAAGAAVAFWFFFATEKELSPRGYERNEMIKCLVGTTKHKKS